MIKIAYVNFWKDPYNDRWFTKFIKENIDDNVIEVSINNTPDILLASVFGNVSTITNIEARVKILFIGENCTRDVYRQYGPSEHKRLANVFDLILGFDESNIMKKILRFPLWLLYYPYYNMNNDMNIINHIETNHKKNIHNTKIYCSLVASHDSGGHRNKLYTIMIKKGNVLSGGKFLNNIKISDGSRGKHEFISQSKYNICTENSSYPHYVTEKIFQALEAGCIPLYWGHDLPEKNILNTNKYVFYNNDNEENFENNLLHTEQFHYEYVFYPSAKHVISKYYQDVIDQIKSKLF